MSVTVPDRVVADLLNKINEHALDVGDAYLQEIHDSTALLRAWLEYLAAYEASGNADVLLSGVSSAIMEAAACLTIGFGRVALGPMRGQIDLVLSWLYFKDHPIEWSRLESHGDGYMQRAELVKYLNEKLSSGFGTRFAELKRASRRNIEDPFSILSAHMHRQSSATVASVASCAEAVSDKAVCDDVVILQQCTSEYLNDVLLSCFGKNWAVLPSIVIADARARLSAAQQAIVFA